MYKLIKLYPGSPKLGTTAVNKQGSIGYIYPDGKIEVEMSSSGDIFKRMVEDMPEFWVKVVEKDYEILEVKGKYGAISSYIEKLDNDLKDKTIFKIKRLSDGEIFTIGDRLDEKCFRKLSRHPLSKGIHDNIITKIAIVKKHASEVAGHLEIQNGKLMFSASNKWNNLNVLLSEAIKYKQPLFTTEDGVDIFEGDFTFGIHAGTFEKLNEYPYIAHNKSNPPEYHLHFSTKEKAEEYILLNKPCLSLQDILDSGWEFSSKGNAINSPLFKQFKETAKSKLK